MSREAVKNNPQSWKKLSIAHLILLFLVLLTFFITFVFYKSSSNKDLVRFTDQKARLHYSIENKLELYTNLLKTSRGFIDTIPVLTKKDFKKFSSSLNFDEDLKGVQGLGYAEVVATDKFGDVARKLSGESGNEFKIFPDYADKFHSVVFYLEPERENTKSAPGFDMASDADRREAMLKACDSGEAAITRKIVPIQFKPEDDNFGFLIYLPIYKTGNIPSTIEERREQIRGFIYCPFRANKFLEEIYRDQKQNDIAVKIYSSELKPENLLTNSVSEKNDGKNQFSLKTYSFDDELPVGGGKWILSFSTLPLFDEQSSLVWTPLILVSGLVFSFLIFGMSLWEAKALETVRLTAAELLESEKQRTILLENEKQARKLAEDANRSKDDFIAIVSHELKTPLNAIAGWAKILQLQGHNDNSRQMAISKITRNLRLQTALIEQLLNYSDLTSNDVRLNLEQVDFVGLFVETCDEMTPLFEEKNIEFQIINEVAVGIVKGDAEKLKMMIYSLFSNALKFTPEKGRIKAELSSRNNFITLLVQDSGRGIDKEFLPFVFDRYKQAEKPNVRNYGGLGLGMTMTEKIVRIHDGEITAESEGIDSGAIFTVRIPCCDCR